MKNRLGKKLDKFDMSPEAIDRRLRELNQLYKLGMAIQQAKHLGKLKDFVHEEIKIDNSKESRQLGILKGKASYKIKNNFKISDEELLK